MMTTSQNSFCIMAQLDTDTNNRFNDRAKLITTGTTKPHITLFNLLCSDKIKTYLEKPSTQKSIAANFQHTFNSINLNSPKGQYKVLGKIVNGTDKRWLVREYDACNVITTLRVFIHTLLATEFGPVTKLPNKRFTSEYVDPITQLNMYIFKFQNGEQYTLSEHHFGINTWIPHVSIMKISTIPQSSQMTDNDILKLWNSKLSNSNVKPISVISMNKIPSLTFSFGGKNINVINLH